MVMTNQGKDMEDNDLDSNDLKNFHMMDSEEFRLIRDEQFQMSRMELGELIGVDYETVKSWELERNPIPSPISLLVRILSDIEGSEYGEKYGLD